MYLGVQELRVQREAKTLGGDPAGRFSLYRRAGTGSELGRTESPGLIYTGEACDMRAQISVQYIV